MKLVVDNGNIIKEPKVFEKVKAAAMQDSSGEIHLDQRSVLNILSRHFFWGQSPCLEEYEIAKVTTRDDGGFTLAYTKS